MAATTQRKTRWASTLMIVVLIVVACYWVYLYQQLSLVNADTVAQMAYQRTLDYARTSQPEISKSLRDRAPEVFDFAESQIMQAPAALSAYLRTSALEKTQVVLDNALPAFNKVIDDALLQSRQAMVAAGGNPKDPNQVAQMINNLATQLDAQVKAHYDDIYNEYDLRAAEFVRYLNQLADGKNLEPRQQHLRNIIVSFLAVAEKKKTMPG
jgi:hypothetical protein